MCVPPEAQRSFFKSILPGQDVVCSYLIVCEGRRQPLVLLITTSNITVTTFFRTFVTRNTMRNTIWEVRYCFPCSQRHLSLLKVCRRTPSTGFGQRVVLLVLCFLHYWIIRKTSRHIGPGHSAALRLVCIYVSFLSIAQPVFGRCRGLLAVVQRLHKMRFVLGFLMSMAFEAFPIIPAPAVGERVVGRHELQPSISLESLLFDRDCKCTKFQIFPGWLQIEETMSWCCPMQVNRSFSTLPTRGTAASVALLWLFLLRPTSLACGHRVT